MQPGFELHPAVFKDDWHSSPLSYCQQIQSLNRAFLHLSTLFCITHPDGKPVSTIGLEKRWNKSSFLLFGVNKSEINDKLMPPNVTLGLIMWTMALMQIYNKIEVHRTGLWMDSRPKSAAAKPSSHEPSLEWTSPQSNQQKHNDLMNPSQWEIVFFYQNRTEIELMWHYFVGFYWNRRGKLSSRKRNTVKLCLSPGKAAQNSLPSDLVGKNLRKTANMKQAKLAEKRKRLSVAHTVVCEFAWFISRILFVSCCVLWLQVIRV